MQGMSNSCTAKSPLNSRASGLREHSTHNACATPGSQASSVSSRLTQKYESSSPRAISTCTAREWEAASVSTQGYAKPSARISNHG